MTNRVPLSGKKRLLALLAALCFAAVSRAETSPAVLAPGGTTPGGVTVSEASILPSFSPMAGTFLYRLRLHNKASFEQDVTLLASAAIERSGSASATVRLAPGGSAFVALPLPPVNVHVFSLSIRDASGTFPYEGGRAFHYYGMSAHSARHSSYYSSSFDDDSCAYLSKSVPYEAVQEAVKALLEKLHKAQGSSYGSYSTPYGSYSCARGEEMSCVKASQVSDPWPTDWRAYLPYPLCIVADRDFPDIPEGAREALRRYVAAGGNLLLVGDRAECLEIRGALFSDALTSLAQNASPDKGAPLHYGLGEAFVHEVADVPGLRRDDLPDDIVGKLVDAMRDAKCVFDAPILKEARTNPYFLIDLANRLHIPAGLFITVLILFVLLAGPVSMLVLARRNRRIWILWVLPAISLVFTFAIVGTMLAREGVHPYSTRDAVTLLAQRDGRALTIGGVAVYAPFSLRGGLDFDRESDIAPVIFADGGSLSYGRTLHYGGGWVAPRTPALFGIRRFDVLRERLEVFESADGIEVVNALGAPLARLTLWDAGGCVHTAASIPSGARVRLVPAQEAPADVVRRIHGVYNSRYGKNYQVGYDWREPEKPSYGERGLPCFQSAYAAEIKGACPFLDDPLRGRSHHAEDSALVFGSYASVTAGGL